MESVGFVIGDGFDSEARAEEDGGFEGFGTGFNIARVVVGEIVPGETEMTYLPGFHESSKFCKSPCSKTMRGR